jgi:hypothetical protein
MADYTGQGSVALNGCCTFYFIPRVEYKYQPGQIVYYKPKAEQGKLEKIVIKKVHVVRNAQTYGKFVFMYVDTLNSLYNQYDLIWEDEAMLLIRDYLEKQIAIYKDAIRRCQIW